MVMFDSRKGLRRISYHEEGIFGILQQKCYPGRGNLSHPSPWDKKNPAYAGQKAPSGFSYPRSENLNQTKDYLIQSAPLPANQTWPMYTIHSIFPRFTQFKKLPNSKIIGSQSQIRQHNHHSHINTNSKAQWYAK